jgi:hypothetical protein
MSQTKAQLIQPVGIFTAPGVNVSGVLTASSFSGDLTGTSAGLTTTANITVGVITATSFFGDASNLTGIAAAPYVGQSTTSQSPTTTIDLSLGNVVYFTHDTDTTVAFANTSTTQEVRFIRTKDDTLTARSITWPSSIIWDGGSAPTLINNPRGTDVQIFNLTTRDTGVTWYAYEEFVSDPQTFGLYSWGYNDQGQLGQNNTTDYSSPVQITGTTWSSISTSYLHSLATKTDGTLWAWGSNNQGQLGQNNTTYRSSPVQIPGTTWSSIDGGYYQSLATKTDGTLWSWGYNNKGQLGQNNKTDYSSPVQIPGTTWSFISCGHYINLATKTDGTLWSWGYNNRGQLGQNNTTDYSSPVQIPGTTWSSISNNGSSGSALSLATKTDGTLWAWGRNQFGQLGQNNRTYYSSPVQIPGTTWSSISGGDYYSLATKTDGTLWSWGYNARGQLGQNNRTYYSSPVQIPGTTWSSINAYQHSLATKTDGTLWAWGRNDAGGRLGQNNTTQYSSPVQIPGTTWSSISAGNKNSLALQYSN